MFLVSVLLPTDASSPIACNHPWWLTIHKTSIPPIAFIELDKDGYGICPICQCEFQTEKPTVEIGDLVP
jgi:hypothetical protein